MSKSKAIAVGAGTLLTVATKAKMDITIIYSEGKWDISTIPERYPLNWSTEQQRPQLDRETKMMVIPPKRHSIGLVRVLSGLILTAATAFVVAGA